MREKVIPLTIMLFAGAITGIICIWRRFDTLYSLKMLLAVLIVFYLIGQVAKRLYQKVCEGPGIEETELEAEENDENQEESQEGTL